MRTLAGFISILLVAVTASAQSALQFNKPVVVSGASGSETMYRFDVNASYSQLIFQTNGGSGDCDLYARQGATPTIVSNTASSQHMGTSETITLNQPAAGAWYLMLRGTSKFSSVTLLVTGTVITRWDFNEQLAWMTPPPGWQDDSQPPQSSATAGYGLTGGSLVIRTRANTTDRFKVRLKQSVTAGTFEWRFYVPSLNETYATTSIGAFLTSPDSADQTSRVREIDFEIVYGSKSERQFFNVTNSNQMMVYFGVQPDSRVGEPGLAKARPTDKRRVQQIAPGYWYIATMKVLPNGGSHQVTWNIRRDGMPYSTLDDYTYLTRYPTTTTYWPECSLENLPLTSGFGDHIATISKETKFDYVTYKQ